MRHPSAPSWVNIKTPVCFTQADDRLHHVDILDQLDEAARADSLAPPKELLGCALQSDRKEYARPSLIGKHAAYILDAVEEHQCEVTLVSIERRSKKDSLAD
eukprot:1006209-Amphidinium_carterae.2